MEKPHRILIVEDEPLIGMMLQDYMEIIGHDVAGVVDCVEAALAALRRERVDLVVLDVNLGNGERCDPVAEALLRDGIPFILSSGDPHVPEALGGRPILPKPYTLADVERALGSLQLSQAA